MIRIRIAAQTYPYSAGLKAVMAHFSGDDGWRTVRPPLMSLSENESLDLINLLEAAGYSPPPMD